MNSRRTRILIADWIPSQNKGELAILLGTLKTFEVLGDVETCIFSFYPELDKDRYPQNVRVIDISRDLHLWDSLPERGRYVIISAWLSAMLQHILFSIMYFFIGNKVLRLTKKRIWKEYCGCDVIITCHDQVNCVYGSRLLRFFPLYIPMLAKTLGKPVVVYATGWGFSDFKNKSRAIIAKHILKILGRYALNNFDLVTVREKESYEFLKNISSDRSHVYLTADPTILLPSVNDERVDHIALEENIDRNKGLLIGMTITRELLLGAYQELANPEERYREALAQVARLVDRLTNDLNATVVFLPHCIEQYKNRDDREVAREVYNLTANKPRVVTITREYTPEELKGLMGIFDIFIGGRVHSVIGALSMGVPSITLTKLSDRRAYGLIGEMLRQEEWVYNVEGLNTEKLFSKIMTLLSRRDEISRNLALQTKIVREKALFNGRLLKTMLDSRKSMYVLI